jgi:hypothetical protein
MQAKLNDLALRFQTDKASNGHNYCPIYETMIGHLQDEKFVLWELGIGGEEHADRGGQSLRMWRHYFKRARIAGLDFYEKSFKIAGVDLYQGSQDDRAILYKMQEKTGTPNVVIDDASHRCDLTIASFKEIFPLMAPGSLYVVEDVHTSYWFEYKGNPNPDDPDFQLSTMAFFQRLTNQLNHYTLKAEFRDGRYADHIDFIHFYPELIIIKKR